jgi:DNA modification methylase
MNRILEIDALLGLQCLAEDSVDACVTDPPYGIRFMGKDWDYQIPSTALWQRVIRVLKPGAHLLCACGTRTQHRMTVNIEDAGFEIRDVICWHYGEGLPKSLDVGNALKKSGASADDQERWSGWGTALKPATQFWTLARKPLSGDKVIGNVCHHGVGALNIDTCRILTNDQLGGGAQKRPTMKGLAGWDRPWMGDPTAAGEYVARMNEKVEKAERLGRHPANVILDEYMAGYLDGQSGLLVSGRPMGKRKAKNNVFGQFPQGREVTGYGDAGGASRFFYVAKADVAERGKGNTHPTVKPLTLMHYLIRLICPIEPGRIVLDPFAGSGTTCIAARQLSLDFIAFEREAESVRIAENRMREVLGMFY